MPGETRESLIELELARIDALQAAFWELSQHGDEKAAAVVLNCMKLRIQVGQLDAPDVSVGQTVLVVQGDEKNYIAALKSAVDN